MTLTDANKTGPLEQLPAFDFSVPIAHTEGVGGTLVGVPPVELDASVPLADDVAAARATRYGVYDTALLRYLGPVFDDPADGLDYGATESGRFQLRRV